MTDLAGKPIKIQDLTPPQLTDWIDKIVVQTSTKVRVIEAGYAKNIDGVNYILDWRFDYPVVNDCGQKRSMAGRLYRDNLEDYSVEELIKISDAYWDKWKTDNPETPFPYTEEAILAQFEEDEWSKQNPWRPPEECVG